ncbi:site-specific tyrosine recombinase XerD [Neptunitalea lumnitzerae]|uniref:Tyrosine recombinase XerC n=1 Tax=Neptunitalea lumnitzerae TaxID=2965509 RepID=A0ABQ5MMF6_9FLAO|nr:site-specific tyrosine recombinase XerD [Neptunitalea sp. Y10]GLB50593.1 tyrosine recombinase XerC [Neptunitalea sp. Y10]
MKWKTAIKDYTFYLKIERGLSDNSVQGYIRDITKLEKYLEENSITTTPLVITDEILQQFIYEASKNLKATSLARLISGIKNFFSYLVFEDLRKDNPAELLESPKTGRKLPDVLSIEEIDMLIAAIDLSSPEGQRNKAILETLYGCGLRVSELITLKISDLFFDEGFIKVTGKGNKDRFVPIANTTMKYINIYVQEIRCHLNIDPQFSDNVFLNRRGKQLTRAMIFTIIKQLSEKIGLQKKISPHTFRHSFATHLLQNGANLIAIQQMLGHSSITTTEIYMHLDRQHLSEVMQNFHPRKH